MIEKMGTPANMGCWQKQGHRNGVVRSIVVC